MTDIAVAAGIFGNPVARELTQPVCTFWKSDTAAHARPGKDVVSKPPGGGSASIQSCERGTKMNNDGAMTVRQFIRLTSDAYGGDVIRKLEGEYGTVTEND